MRHDSGGGSSRDIRSSELAEIIVGHAAHGDARICRAAGTFGSASASV
jgi:hypothetical protein